MFWLWLLIACLVTVYMLYQKGYLERIERFGNEINADALFWSILVIMWLAILFHIPKTIRDLKSIKRDFYLTWLEIKHLFSQTYFSKKVDRVEFMER